MTEKESVFQLARLLAILGGIVVALWGVLEFTSLVERRSVPSIEFLATATAYGILAVVFGLVSLAGSRFVKNIGWSVLLIVVGVLAFSLNAGFPWYLGALLVVFSGLAGIAGRIV